MSRRLRLSRTRYRTFLALGGRGCLGSTLFTRGRVHWANDRQIALRRMRFSSSRPFRSLTPPFRVWCPDPGHGPVLPSSAMLLRLRAPLFVTNNNFKYTHQPDSRYRCRAIWQHSKRPAPLSALVHFTSSLLACCHHVVRCAHHVGRSLAHISCSTLTLLQIAR